MLFSFVRQLGSFELVGPTGCQASLQSKNQISHRKMVEIHLQSSKNGVLLTNHQIQSAVSKVNTLYGSTPGKILAERGTPIEMIDKQTGIARGALNTPMHAPESRQHMWRSSRGQGAAKAAIALELDVRRPHERLVMFAPKGSRMNMRATDNHSAAWG